MLPDIGVLGPYTYLVTEVFWGVVALALLLRADALARAAKTALVLYPFAYVWDWYTLTVGVFEIRLRTGVDLLGIPVEEHLFMIVVPALVVGFHETLHGAPGAAGGDATDREGDRAPDADPGPDPDRDRDPAREGSPPADR